MPVTFSPSALSEARRRLYGANAGQSTSRATQLARIEQEAYEQQVRANKAAADAERKAAEDAAKQVDDERKLANAQRTNELLAQGRRYHIDRVTGEPRPLQTDEEFAAAKAEKGRKLQEAEAKKKEEARQKTELDKVAADEAVLRENEKSIQRNQQREELEREEKRRKLKGIQEEYEKRLKAADDMELNLTPEQRQATVGTIENVKKRLADLDAAKFEKQKESLKFDTAQDERAALLRKREAAIKRGEAPTPSPEPLIADPVEFEQSAAQHQAEVDQFNAEQIQHQAKMAALERENERLMSLPHSAADVSEDGKWHKDVIPKVKALNDVVRNRGPEWQAQQQRIQEQARVLNESAAAMNAQAKAANERAKAEQAAAREAAYQDFEKVAPGMGKEYQAILDDSDKRAAALRTKYAGREDAPEAKAAFTALEQDITGKLDGLRGKIEVAQKAKSANLEKLWNQFGVGEQGSTTMRDWVTDKSTDPEYDKLGGVSSMPENFKAKIKELGLNEQEARNYMETRRQLDWSNPLSPEMAEKSAELTRPLREKLGITDMLEPVRRLPNGAIIPNPVLGGDEEAFKKAIEATDGTPEQKAEAMKLWPSYRRQYGEGLLVTFAKQSAFGEDFNEWRESGKAKSTDPVEQALQYQDEMKGRSIFRRWGDLIASNVTAGFMDVTQAILGSSAAVLGAVPGIGQGLSELAGANAENATSLVNTQEQLSNTGLAGSIAGTIARMAPGVAATVGTGSMAGGMIFGAAQTTGSLYGDAYNTLREQGKSHAEAWKASAPASLAAGAMTAGLTKLFPGGVTALANNPEARASVRAMMAGFLSSGKAIAKGALDEIPEEVIDEAMSQLAQGYAEGRNPDDVVRDFITGLPELVVASGLMGGGMQALKDRQDRRAGGPPPDITPEVPETPTPDAGPLPEEKAAVQAAIAGFNPTDPAIIAAMPDAIKGKNVPVPQVITRAKLAAQALTDLAQGKDANALTPEEKDALGIKVNPKTGEVLPVSSSIPALAQTIARADKDGNITHHLIIADAAREWLKNTIPDAGAMIQQTAAERIDAINNPKPKPEPKQEVSNTRVRKMAQKRQNDLVFKRDGKAGAPDEIATNPRQLSKDEEAELEFLHKHLADDNIQAIADKYGIKLKSAIISGVEADQKTAGETLSSLVAGTATDAQGNRIDTPASAIRRKKPVAETGPVTQAPAPEAAASEIDPGPITALTPTQEAVAEGSQMNEGALAPAGVPESTTQEVKGLLYDKTESGQRAQTTPETSAHAASLADTLNDGDVIESEGSTFVVRVSKNGSRTLELVDDNFQELGEVIALRSQERENGKGDKLPARGNDKKAIAILERGKVTRRAAEAEAKIAPTPGAAGAVATRPALGKAPPLQRKAIGKGMKGGSSYAEFATVDDADAFAYAAKLKAMQAKNVSPAKVKELGEAAKGIITRISKRLGISEQEARPVLSAYNVAVRTQAKAIREGESFYAPTLAEFMAGNENRPKAAQSNEKPAAVTIPSQTDTKADIPAAKTAPTAGETVINPGDTVTSDVYKSEGEIEIIGPEQPANKDHMSPWHKARTKGGRTFEIETRFINGHKPAKAAPAEVDTGLKTPEQWSKEKDVIILSADGWRSTYKLSAKDFNEPISEQEYLDRLSVSTIKPLKAGIDSLFPSPEISTDYKTTERPTPEYTIRQETGDALIQEAEKQFNAYIKKQKGPRKARAEKVRTIILKAIRKYNGHLPIRLMDGNMDMAFDRGAILINPTEAINRAVSDAAGDTDAEKESHAVLTARDLFYHEFIHRYVSTMIGDARVMDVWERLPEASKAAAERAYSLRVEARTGEAFRLSPRTGGHEYYRMMVELTLEGRMTEVTIGKGLAEKWQKILNDILAFLRDLERQFAGIPNESARKQLISDVQGDIKLVTDAIKAAKSISPADAHSKLVDETARWKPLHDAVKNLPASTKELLARLSGMGVKVIIAKNDAEIESITGKKTRGSPTGLVTTLADGSVVVIIQASRKSASLSKVSLQSTLDHELIHAASILAKRQNPEAHAKALQAVTQGSPDFDGQLHDFMRKEYNGYDELTPTQKLEEALRAIIEGRYKKQTSSRGFKNFLQAFLDFISSTLPAKNPAIMQAVANIEAVMGVKSISPDAEPAQATNAGAGSTSGKPVEGSSTTVANPVSINTEKESSGNDEAQNPDVQDLAILPPWFTDDAQSGLVEAGPQIMGGSIAGALRKLPGRQMPGAADIASERVDRAAQTIADTVNADIRKSKWFKESSPEDQSKRLHQAASHKGWARNWLVAIDAKDAATLLGYNNSQNQGSWKVFQQETGIKISPNTDKARMAAIVQWAGQEAVDAAQRAKAEAYAKREAEQAAARKVDSLQNLKRDAAAVRLQGADGNGAEWVEAQLKDGWRVVNISKNKIPQYRLAKGTTFYRTKRGDKGWKSLLDYGRALQAGMDEQAASMPEASDEDIARLFGQESAQNQAPEVAKPTAEAPTSKPPEQMTPEELYQDLAKAKIATLNAEIDGIKKNKNNPKSPWFGAKSTEVDKRQREIEQLQSPIMADWGIVIDTLDAKIAAREPLSKTWDDLLTQLRLPKEFEARVKKAGYAREGDLYVYRPQEAPKAQEMDEGDAALGEAFAGLFASPTVKPLAQSDLPKDRRDAMMKAASTLIDLGLRKPEELAQRLDKLAPNGALRKYTRAFWRLMSGFDSTLEENPHWPTIYGELDQVSSRPPSAEGVTESSPEQGAAPASVTEVNLVNIYKVDDATIKAAASQEIARRQQDALERPEFGKYRPSAPAKRFAADPSRVNAIAVVMESLKAQAALKVPVGVSVAMPQRADTPASGLISDEESARLDSLTVNNKDRLDKLSANQLSQLNKELLRQPSSAKRDAILATEHPDDIKNALDIVTKSKADTPATAEAKVEEQVQVVAATESQRDAKEIKSDIVAALEKAMSERDPANVKLVTFQIPGDGTFKIYDSADNIKTLLARVKRPPTKIEPENAPKVTSDANLQSLAASIARASDAGDILAWVTNAANADEWAMKVVSAVRAKDAALVKRAEDRLAQTMNEAAPAQKTTSKDPLKDADLLEGVSESAVNSKLMADWMNLRKELPSDVIVLYRLGDFYETFARDARAMARDAMVTLTKRNGVPMAGIPHHSAAGYIKTMQKAGWRIAIAESPTGQGKREVGPIMASVDQASPESPEMAAEPESREEVAPEVEVKPITGFDTARAFISKLRKGEVTAEQVRTAWEQLKSQRPAILADLMKMKVDELLPMAGMSARKSDGKASVAKSALGTLDLYFNPDDSISYSYGGDFQANKDAAMDEKVAKWTDEMIVEQAKARREAAEASKAAKEKAFTNPETKEEWEKFIYRRGRQSLTDADVKRILKIRSQSARTQEVLERGEKLLTPDELARYDAVIGINRKEKAQDAAEAKARVYGVEANTETDIIETTHTKKGYPLFVVKLADRVERPVYDRLNVAAKKLGGYYSSYRGSGAVPGFQFRTRAEAEQFQAASRGETIDRTEAIQERQGEKKNAAAERLIAQADKLEASADEVLNADRQTNTARRARMAASAENAAESNKAMARTMRNLAEAIASGEATHLDGVNTKAHVATLESLARSGKDKAETAEGLSYADREKRKYDPATPEQMAYAAYPYPYLHKSDVLSMVALGEKTPGAKLLAARVAKIRFATHDGEQGYLTDAGQIEEFRELAQKLTERGKPLWDTYAWKFESYDRVRRMGLMDLPSLRAALREFTQFRSTKARPDKLKEMERALIGQKLPGFFPTPRSVIDDMVASADIGEGMRVLEPSAGKGDIADAVREAGADVDVIERSGTLRDILTEKKFNIIGQDFMDETPSPIYDAVLMNPPFEEGAEMRHVRHAYDFLKPGGRLIAVMSEGPFGRSDKASAEFREWLDTVGTSEKLPQGTFASAEAFRQTGVSTRLVTIIKPAPLQASPSGFVGDTDVLQLPITDAEIMDAADNATETPEAILEEWAATEEPLQASPTAKVSADFEAQLESQQTLDLEDDQVSIPKFNADKDALVESPLIDGVHLMVRNRDEVADYGPHEFFFNDNDDNVLGFARLTKSPKEVSINLIYVDPDRQGQGIGSAFYKYWLDQGISVKSDAEITDGTAELYKSLVRQGYGAAIENNRAVLKPMEALRASPSSKEGDTGKKPRRNVANQASNLPGARDAWSKLSQTYEDKELETVSYQKIEAAVDEVISEQEGFDSLYNQIVGKMREGIVLSLEEDIARRMIARVLWIDGNDNPASRTKAKLLFMADMREASETARKLGSRVDKVETPQQRLDNAMRNILSPSSNTVRERLVNVWSGAEKLAAIKELKRRLASTQDTLQRERAQRELEKAQARKDQNEVMEELAREDDAKVNAILKRNGLTQTDLFLSVDDRFAMQEAILGLARVHLSQQSAAHKKAIEMSVRGYSDNAIAKETGLTVAEVSNTAEHFRNVVAKQLTAKEVGKGNTFSKFIQWGKRIINEIGGPLRASPTAPLGGMVAKGTPSAAAVAAQIQAILNASIPTKGQRNAMGLHAATAKGKNGQNVKVFVPYNPADWKQVYRVARELSTREATKLDKAYEYWINGILSGPQTHVVNTASNLLSTAWAYGPQWFAEATANVAIRNPNAPQFGEFRHVWAGFFKGIMPALRNFALAWDTEADPVEHQYLDKPVTVMFQGGNLDKVGGIRPSFGGTFGRVVRIPGRFLVAQDAFAKTLIMHAESAAMAYRLGKKQGLAGAALTNFMASQIATHGSESWQHAFERATELTFQDENDITKAVEGVTNALKRAKFVGGLMRYLLPFVRTPTNIYRAGIRKAGGSAGMLLYRLGKSGYYAIKGNNNEFRSYREGAMVKDVSESVMATALWFIVMGMSEGDDDDNQKTIEITGSRPFGVASAGERASQLRQEGGSNLIIIRKNPLTGEKLDKPIQFAYGRYEPIALALSTLVDGAREFKEWTRFQPENRTTDKLAGSMMRHVLAQAKEKTFLQGVSGVLQFIEDAGSNNFSGKDILMKNLMNGAIPNLIRQPYRLSQDEIADAKKAESELSRSLGIGQPKVNEAGQPVQRGGNAVTRVLFPVASKPSTELFDAALKKWNATNPDQQWNPDPLTKADLYVYGPKVDGKMQQVPLKDPAKITKFEQQIGQKFADYSARKLMAAGWRLGKPVTPQMIDAIKEVRTNAIKSVRASMGREERFGTTATAPAPSTPPARPLPAPAKPVSSIPPRPVPMKDDAAERAKARLIEARKRLNYGSK